MKKTTIIILVIVFVIIIIAVVAFLIYKNNQKKKQEAQQQMAILQQQLAQNPQMPTEQKGDLLAQISNLAAIIGQFKGGKEDKPSFSILNPTGNWNPEPAGFPLSKALQAKKNSYVETLQKAINTKCKNKMKSMGMLPLTTDGRFGTLTEKAAAACVGSNTVSWQQYQTYIA